MTDACAESLDRTPLAERWKLDSDEPKAAKALASLRHRLLRWYTTASTDAIALNPPSHASAPNPDPDMAPDAFVASVDELLARVRTRLEERWQAPYGDGAVS